MSCCRKVFYILSLVLDTKGVLLQGDSDDGTSSVQNNADAFVESSAAQSFAHEGSERAARVGDTIELHGLGTHVEMNGLVGVVIKEHEGDKSSWVVQLMRSRRTDELPDHVKSLLAKSSVEFQASFKKANVRALHFSGNHSMPN